MGNPTGLWRSLIKIVFKVVKNLWKRSWNKRLTPLKLKHLFQTAVCSLDGPNRNIKKSCDPSLMGQIKAMDAWSDLYCRTSPSNQHPADMFWHAMTCSYCSRPSFDLGKSNPLYSSLVIVFQPNVLDHNEKKRHNLPPNQPKIPLITSLKWHFYT